MSASSVPLYLTLLANLMGQVYRHSIISSITISAAVIYWIYYLIFLASVQLLVGLLACLCLYLLYYWLSLVQVPQIHCQQQFYKFLRNYCPTVFETYYPTVWVIGGHARSFVRGFVQRHLPVQYERETVTLDDGGTLCLDWTTANQQRSDPLKIILVLPGLTGGSNENYAKSICHKAIGLGYTAVVFNNRGCADAPLTTPKMYCATKTDDFHAVLLLIRNRYPDSPVFLMGVSLGGVLITQYLCGVGEHGKEAGVVGALCVSSTFDGVVTSKQLEQPMSLLTFNHYLTGNLVQMLKRHRDVFKKADGLPFDIDSAIQAKTLAQFDERITVPMFNYKSSHEYYVDATTTHRLHHISVPYLALNAGDDPFAPDFALPVSQFSLSHYTAMIQTTVGGHIGFADSLWPSGQTLVEKIFAEYSTACFEHGNDLKPMD